MPKHERNTAVAAMHSIVAVLLLLAGGASLGLGIWLQTTGQRGVSDLDFSSSVLDVILRVPIVFIVIGIFLLITGIAGLIAMARRCIGTTFRVIYIVMALVIVAALGAICAFAAIVRANARDNDVQVALLDAWKATVVDHPDQICDLEEHFKCRGFLDNQCVDCPTGAETGCSLAQLCAKCPAPNASPDVGCYDEIVDNLVTHSLPVAIVSGVLAVVVFVDMMLTCCL